MESYPVSEMADVRTRLTALEDQRDVLANLHRYGQTIDAGDEAGWVDCFTEDGNFTAKGRRATHTGLDVTGRAELQAFIAEHSRRPYAFHLHCIVEPIIAVDGDEATADSYLFVLMEHEGAPVLRVFGRYHDDLVRCSDGRWRFRRRAARIDSQVAGLPPLAGGMARFRDPATGEPSVPV
jgi:hypothetical protein